MGRKGFPLHPKNIKALKGKFQGKSNKQIAKEQGITPQGVGKRQEKAAKALGIDENFRQEFADEIKGLITRSIKHNLKKYKEITTIAAAKGLGLYQDKTIVKGDMNHKVDISAQINIQVDNLKKMIGMPGDAPLNLKVKSKRITAKDDESD
jgi:hypothetical protein